MTTVRDVITDAMEDIVVQADEAPIEPSEAKTAIRVLNQMMAAFDSDGISLGYTIVNSLDDEITVSAGAVLGITKNLAVNLSDKYLTGEIPAKLLRAADKGVKTLRNIAVTVGSTDYPGTLPRGSGNDYPDYSDSTFYPGLGDTILSEQNGSISLEDETEEGS